MIGKSGCDFVATGFDADLGESSPKESGLRCKPPVLLDERITSGDWQQFAQRCHKMARVRDCRQLRAVKPPYYHWSSFYFC